MYLYKRLVGVRFVAYWRALGVITPMSTMVQLLTDAFDPSTLTLPPMSMVE